MDNSTISQFGEAYNYCCFDQSTTSTSIPNLPTTTTSTTTEYRTTLRRRIRRRLLTNTSSPTTEPTLEPTVEPTFTTTSSTSTTTSYNVSIFPCLVLVVNVINASHFDAFDFNGVYHWNPTAIAFGYSVWTLPSNTEQEIHHTINDWVIQGKGDERLSIESNSYIPDAYAIWKYGTGYAPNPFENVTVEILCSDTTAPTIQPTAEPTANDTNCPSDINNANTTIMSYDCCIFSSNVSGIARDALDQGRINAIIEWGIFKNTAGNKPHYENALVIKQWSSESQTILNQEYGDTEDIEYCDPFTLSPDDYIIGYTIWTDFRYGGVFGLEFETLYGSIYSCYDESKIVDGNVAPWSELYECFDFEENFYFLTGWKIVSGLIIDSISFEFTKKTKTLSPTPYPTFPSYNPTIDPTEEDVTLCAQYIGTTVNPYDINYHVFNLSTVARVVIDACQSSYDTWLYFNYSDGTGIENCDDCGDCSISTRTKLQYNDLQPDQYLIGIGGYQDEHGDYIINVYCYEGTLPPTPAPTNETESPTPFPSLSPTTPTVNPTTGMPTKGPTSTPSFVYSSLFIGNFWDFQIIYNDDIYIYM